MTLKEFKQNLDAFIEANPGALAKEVVTSSDDEGNSFHQVIFTPTLGVFNPDYREFSTEDKDKANAVCLN